MQPKGGVHGSWTKSDPALVERFDAALPDHPALERRKMFGYPATFVNGNYFAGLHEQRVVIRLPGDTRDRLPDLAGAANFSPMGPERGMKDWYEVPPEIATDGGRLAALLEAAVEEVAALPPKVKKPKKSRS